MRSFAIVGSIVALALFAPKGAWAQATPNVYDSFASGQAVHDRGQIRGVVERVDYGSNTLVIRTSRHRVSVAVLPSTEIYVKGQYATLADVHRGAHAELSINEVGGRLVAQVIRL